MNPFYVKVSYILDNIDLHSAWSICGIYNISHLYRGSGMAGQIAKVAKNILWFLASD